MACTEETEIFVKDICHLTKNSKVDKCPLKDMFIFLPTKKNRWKPGKYILPREVSENIWRKRKI